MFFLKHKLYFCNSNCWIKGTCNWQFTENLHTCMHREGWQNADKKRINHLIIINQVGVIWIFPSKLTTLILPVIDTKFTQVSIQQYTTGSVKYFMKPFFKIVCIYFISRQYCLYCDTSHARSGVDQMYIHINSKDQIEFMISRSFSFCTTIKTFDLSTI